VDRNTVCSGHFRQHGGGYGIGFQSQPGLPDGCNMVYVDSKLCHNNAALL
jgi:hypothetical protein